jgi:RNA polymerase sigma factor (sigma-70 family)
VHTVALRVGLSEPDAEDCAQHVWMTLYRNRRSIKDPKALPSWLIKTTHRKAVEISKQFSRKEALEQGAAPSFDAVTLPDQELYELELRAVLQAAMGELDPRCRQLLSILYFSPDKKTYSEIARTIKVKSNALGPLRSRCLTKLKKILKNIGYEWD